MAAFLYTDIPAAGETISVTIATISTLIPGVSKITWDGFSRAERNPKPLSIGHVVKKRGLPNFGSIKLEIEYNPSEPTHIYLRDAVTTQALTLAYDVFKITSADGLSVPAVATANGYVKEFSVDSGEVVSGIVTASCTIEVDNATFVAGTP